MAGFEEEHAKMLKDIHECIVGNVETERPGLIERVRKLEGFNKVVIAIVSTGTIALISKLAGAF